MTNFKPGQKVICINDSVGFESKLPIGIIKNEIYTFKRYLGFHSKDHYPAMEIEEVNKDFSSSRFRPAIDISNSTIESIIEDIGYHEYELIETKINSPEPLKQLTYPP